MCSFSSLDQKKGRKMVQEIRSNRVDREAKEEKEISTCILSRSTQFQGEDILVVLSSASSWWGRFRIRSFWLDQNTEAIPTNAID